MTGELTLSSSTPSSALIAASKGYVDTGLATKQNSIGYVPVNKAGDTMTGALTLAADPVSALQAATKQYADTKVAKAGDTMTGPLTLPANATLALQAVTKQQMDAADALNTPLAAFTGANQSLTGSGYQKLPGGLIIQWGTGTTASNGLATITWPIPFPNNVLSVQVSANQLSSLNFAEIIGPYNLTLTTGAFAGYYIGGSPTTSNPSVVNFTYLAIGF